MLDRALQYYRAQSGTIARNAAEESAMLFFGWIPGTLGIAARSIVWRLLADCRGTLAADTGVIIKHSGHIEFGDGVFLDRRVYLHGGTGGLKIGSRTRIMYGAQINVFNYRNLSTSRINIGSDCVVGAGCLITGQGGVDIGDSVIIAPKVMILPVDHICDNPDLPIKEQGLEAKPIVVESNAWIGAGAIILGGVKIGKGSVIGAGSVVTADVPPRCVAAGNPARVIKNLDDAKK